MLLYFVIGVVVVIGSLVAFVATRPDSFRVQRSAIVEAPAHEVFEIVNDLTNWGRWSPYDSRDPDMQKDFSGPKSGVGARYAWSGNNQVGAGQMTIVASQPGELVGMKLEFSRPFKCCNDVHFTFEPVSSGTNVSWIMDGKNTLFSKAMSLVMSMDKMCGPDFEQGLSNLNKVARSSNAGSI
jgi:hypothetical protein